MVFVQSNTEYGPRGSIAIVLVYIRTSFFFSSRDVRAAYNISAAVLLKWRDVKP